MHTSFNFFNNITFSWFTFISLIINIIAFYQFFYNLYKSSREKDAYAEQLDAILHTCQQNSTLHHTKMQEISKASFMDNQTKFALNLNELDNQNRWNAITNTVFGLMKSVDQKKLKSFSDVNQYLLKDSSKEKSQEQTMNTQIDKNQ